jgi:hypothetical protein
MTQGNITVCADSGEAEGGTLSGRNGACTGVDGRPLPETQMSLQGIFSKLKKVSSFVFAFV